jgi:AraC family transcriptional regulator, regulatory protein of adaptative response / methylated-DNA-[protein]-cysteine methyltransferase
MTSTLAQQHKRALSSVADDPRWARIVTRDKTADDHLWYSVVTTGVYCRPSCPSRTANPKNVQLHDSLESAKATGFRPCRRCNPDGLSTDTENAALVAKACRLIGDSEEEPSLDKLANAVGLSPSYFHRMFKAATGVTPKDYAAAHRAAKVREGLASGSSVTEAIYDAGFNSSGRFYEKSADMLGMTPSQYRAGGANEEIKFAVGQSYLGAILVASTKKGVAAILLGDDPNKLVRDSKTASRRLTLLALTATTRTWLRAWLGSSRSRGWASTFPLMSEARPSRSAFGRRFGKYRPAQRCPTLTSRGVLARRSPSAQWRELAPRINSLSPFPVIV